MLLVHSVQQSRYNTSGCPTAVVSESIIVSGPTKAFCAHHFYQSAEYPAFGVKSCDAQKSDQWMRYLIIALT